MNWFEGALSVKAVMMAGRRPVMKLVVDQKKKDKDTAFILRQAARAQANSSPGVCARISGRRFANAARRGVSYTVPSAVMRLLILTPISTSRLCWRSAASCED